MSHENAAFCGETCLKKNFPPGVSPMGIGKKANTLDGFSDGKILFLPVQRTAPPMETRLLGGYESRHGEALRLLMEHPIPGVLPVLGLCNCTYEVPFIEGNVFFDANTIPDALRSRQSGVLDARVMQRDWKTLSAWSAELARGLIGLHKLGLSHGDVTAFNVIVKKNGSTIWIDLENLNFDPVQRDNDAISFFCYVFLFACELLPEVPVGLLERFASGIKQTTTAEHFLTFFCDAVTQEYPLRPSSLKKNQADVLELIGKIGRNLVPRNGFHGNFARLMFRSAVYFQKEFLWLVNYNMKVMRFGFYDLYNRLSVLNETLSGSEEERKKMETLLRENTGLVDSLNRKCVSAASLDSGVELLKGELKTLQDTLLSGNAAWERLSEELVYSRRLAERMQEESSRLSEELQERDSRIARFEEELAEFPRIRSVNAVLLDCKADLEAKNVELDTKCRELSAECADLSAKCRELSAECVSLSETCRKFGGENRRLSGELASLRSELDASAAEKEGLKVLNESYEEKILKLVPPAESAPVLEHRLYEAGLREKRLQEKERKLLDLFETVKAFAVELEENKSLRVAKALQILKHPDIAGASGKPGAAWRLLKRIVRREPSAPGYRVLGRFAEIIDMGIAGIEAESASVPFSASAPLVPPDESVLPPCP